MQTPRLSHCIQCKTCFPRQHTHTHTHTHTHAFGKLFRSLRVVARRRAWKVRDNLPEPAHGRLQVEICTTYEYTQVAAYHASCQANIAVMHNNIPHTHRPSYPATKCLPLAADSPTHKYRKGKSRRGSSMFECSNLQKRFVFPRSFHRGRRRRRNT